MIGTTTSYGVKRIIDDERENASLEALAVSTAQAGCSSYLYPYEGKKDIELPGLSW